ncbi:MAG: EAL domain-containing protein [Spirochaetaceae bacterium]|nr:EAL domain-containing protein [Spirochaetaceae bacterium]
MVRPPKARSAQPKIRSGGLPFAVAASILALAFNAALYFRVSGNLTADAWESKRRELVRIVDIAVAALEGPAEAYRSGSIPYEEAVARMERIVSNLRYRDEIGENYVFLCSMDGVLLAHPFDKARIGKNLMELRDADGVYLMRELVAAAASGGGFAGYRYEYPLSIEVGRKLSYAKPIPGMDLFVATGLYIDKTFARLGTTLASIAFGIVVVMAFYTLAGILGFSAASRSLARISVAETRFRAVFNGIDHLVALLDVEGRILDVNEAALKFRGITAESVAGRIFWETPWWEQGSSSAEDAREAVAAAAGGDMARFEALNLDAQGHSRNVSLSASPVLDGEGNRRFLIVEGHDITSLRKQEARIRSLAYFDQTTGLPNRARLIEEFALRVALDPERRRALAVVDIGNIRYIDNTFGQSAGDLLLKTVAGRLEASVPRGSLVARLVGGAFAVVFEDEGDSRSPAAARESFSRLAAAVLEITRMPFDLGAQRVHATAQLGLARYPEDAVAVEDILRKAEAALHRAKATAAADAQVFDESMSREIRERLELEEALREPSFFKNAALHFQPQYATLDRRLIGYEALLRWTDPRLGAVPPSRFIPLAEETGIIVGIGYWALREARRFAESLAALGRSGLSVAVNVSPVQLLDPSFSERVAEILAEGGLPRAGIVFEITESSLIASFEEATEKLAALRAAGCGVHLDDFGTGFSSLSYLRRLPLDALKLDKTFIDGVEEDLRARAIVGAMVEIAHGLGIEVVAEGVEREEQLSILRYYGCDAVQGWLTGKAMPAQAAAELAAAEGRKT